MGYLHATRRLVCSTGRIQGATPTWQAMAHAALSAFSLAALGERREGSMDPADDNAAPTGDAVRKETETTGRPTRPARTAQRAPTVGDTATALPGGTPLTGHGASPPTGEDTATEGGKKKDVQATKGANSGEAATSGPAGWS
jgi:hypothetical protein